MMPEDKIEKKFQTLLEYLKVGAKIVRKIFTPDAFNYPFWAPVYERDEDTTPTITITYTDIRKGKFTIPDGIYPIVEIVQELNLAEYIRTGDKKKLERKVDLKVNLGPEKGKEIILRWLPEITIVDDGTDKSFIKNWEKVFGEEIFLLRSDIILFLIVKNGALELRYFSMSKNNLVRYEKNEDNKIELNYIWEEESVKYDRVKFAVDLLLEGDISTFGRTKIKQRYLLNRDFWGLIIDILWFDYDEKNKMYWGMKEFVEKYWSKDMFKDRRDFLYINSIDWQTNKNLLEILEKNKRILDEIQTNPDKYPLTIPSPLNAQWVKYDDALRCTSTRWETPTKNTYHSLGYGIYLITQYNINQEVKFWDKYKFTTNYIALLGNGGTYVIYDMPKALVNYYKGLVDTGGRIGLVFSWSSPIKLKYYLTFFYIHSPFNPYVEKDGALYIPDAISKLLLYAITELEPKIQKWIETQAQEDKKELDEILEKILQEAKMGQFSGYTISKFDETAEEKINKKDRIKIWEYEWEKLEKLEKEKQTSSKKEEKKEKRKRNKGAVIEVYSGLQKTEHYIEETKHEDKILEISESKEEKQQEEEIQISESKSESKEEEQQREVLEIKEEEKGFVEELKQEEEQKQFQEELKPEKQEQVEEKPEIQTTEEQKETTEKPKRKKKEEKISEPQQEQDKKEKEEKETEEVKERDIMDELEGADIEAKVKSKVQVKLPEDVLEELISEKQEKKITKRNESRKSKYTDKKGKGKGKRRK
jgi:hypothetical protein